MAGKRAAAACLSMGLLGVVPAFAQDVTLTSRDGSIVLDGTLQAYDGEVYRIASRFGPLTVAAEGVVCTGPACPDLYPPVALIRITGDGDAGLALLRPLFAAFAAQRGLGFHVAAGPGFAATIRDPGTSRPLAEVSFTPATPGMAALAMREGRADLAVTFEHDAGLGTRVIALDALTAIVGRDNGLSHISAADLARSLAGEVVNWSEIGGPDMPLVLHALTDDAGLQQAVRLRLGRNVGKATRHATTKAMALAVARDPYALAVTSRSAQRPARALPLRDSCGFALAADALAVKSGDHPLSLPVLVLTPRRRLPLLAREFLAFLGTGGAQAAISDAGYVDRGVEWRPLADDATRLIAAIGQAGGDTTLVDLQRLAGTMADADRLSLTFRFEAGTTSLDTASRQAVADLAALLSIDDFQGRDVMLVGFSDGMGPATDNIDLARNRAATVLAAIRAEAPDLPEARLPLVQAFGEAMPMACDTTPAGQRLNRRVEVWLKPAARLTDTPPPGN